MKSLRVVAAVAAKDLRIELRGRHAVGLALPFAGTLLLAFGLALGPGRALLQAAAPGLLWLALLFSSTLLGMNRPYDRLPYVFSDQYDVGMEHWGLATASDRVVVRGDPATRQFVAFWLRDGRVVAGMNVNVWDVAESIRALIHGGRDVNPMRLADPDIPIEELATG